MTRVVREKPLVQIRAWKLLTHALMSCAGNSSPVAAENQLLDVIGDVLAERQEAHAHLAGGRAAHDFGRQVERLDDDVAQRDLEDSHGADRQGLRPGEIRALGRLA